MRVVTLNGSASFTPPHYPMSAVEETFFVREVWYDVEWGDVFSATTQYTFNIRPFKFQHILLSLVLRLSGARHRGRVRCRQGQTPPPFCCDLYTLPIIFTPFDDTCRCVPPPSEKIGEGSLLVLSFDCSACSIRHWVKWHLFHLLQSRG